MTMRKMPITVTVLPVMTAICTGSASDNPSTLNPWWTRRTASAASHLLRSAKTLSAYIFRCSELLVEHGSAEFVGGGAGAEKDSHQGLPLALRLSSLRVIGATGLAPTVPDSIPESSHHQPFQQKRSPMVNSGQLGPSGVPLS